MSSHRKILGNLLTALAAILACAARVHLDEGRTSVCSFVRQLPEELSPCGVKNAFGQPALHHALHVQSLDGDECEAGNDALAGMVREVPTRLCLTFPDSRPILGQPLLLPHIDLDG